MKTLSALALLLLANCACHQQTSDGYPTTPPAYGFVARIHAHRALHCVIDDDFSAQDCDAVARRARAINAVVGFELLSPPSRMSFGEAKAEISQDPDHLRDITYVMGEDLDDGTLGLTRFGAPHAKGNERPGLSVDHYLHTELISFLPEIWEHQDAYPHVVIHELLHSVGAEHADQQGAFDSIEVPYWYPDATEEITPADEVALLAAYGCHHGILGCLLR